MSEMTHTAAQAPRHGPMADAAAQALFEAAARVTRHHLCKLDARFRGTAAAEELTGNDWNSDLSDLSDDLGPEAH